MTAATDAAVGAGYTAWAVATLLGRYRLRLQLWRSTWPDPQ